MGRFAQVRSSWRASLFAVSLFFIGAGAVRAQARPQVREGFFASIALGYGSLGVSDAGSREGGLSGGLKLGGTVSPQFLLAGETLGWYKSEFGASVEQGFLGLTAQYYPSVASGFFVKGGPGVAILRAGVSGFGSESTTGWGVQGGVGYDIRVGRMISLTPQGTFLYGGYSGGSTTLLQLSVGVTFH